MSVIGYDIRLEPMRRCIQGSNGLEGDTGPKTLNSFWQVDKSSSPGSSKLISEERSTVPDRST